MCFSSGIKKIGTKKWETNVPEKIVELLPRMPIDGKMGILRRNAAKAGVTIDTALCKTCGFYTGDWPEGKAGPMLVHQGVVLIVCPFKGRGWIIPPKQGKLCTHHIPNASLAAAAD